MKFIKQSLAIVLSVFLMARCGNKKTSEEQDDYILKGDTIIVPQESIIAKKIKTETVKEEIYRREMITAGTVKAIPTMYAEIAPPFSGRVLKSYVRLGQEVTPGSPIFEISSREYFNAQKDYFDAKQEFHQAELNLKRQQDLFKYGVGVQRELEEAKTEFETKKSAFFNASAALRIFNINPENIVLGQPLIVTSPIKGRIVDNRIVIGQYLKEDAPPIAIVAELSKVWIIGQIKEKDIRFIHELDGAEIMVAAYPNRKFVGKVYHINEIVDESTRSVQVIIECSNEEHILKPGMYVTVKFTSTPEKTIFVPAKSVLQYNDKSFVFVQTQKGKYIRRYVETSITDNGRIMILSGLKPNEVIISEGAIYLLEAK
ncbi:MAG: efflux RND transporter periplasmic adaptor subunit [Bacteroidetes bacterium]|nr:MAG: efflux RND transporter periplasmic adaptor subunit [Bacteroidota bacterium]